MHRAAVPASSARRTLISRPRLATWVAAAVLAAAGALATAPVAAGAATAGPFPLQAPSAGQAIAGWGVNDKGELGTGTATSGSALTPVLAALPPGTLVAQVAPGCTHALALTSTGSVLAWGDNFDGELGNGTRFGFKATPAPVPFPAGVRIRQVSAGCDFSLAVSTDGQVYGWGSNGSGQLGTTKAASAPQLTPVLAQLPAGAAVQAVSAGQDHALAVTTTGQVLAWGSNFDRQLGTGSTSAFDATPAAVRLPGGTRIISVNAAAFFSQAVTATGQVLGWGTQANGVLGNGLSTGIAAAPVRALIPPGLRVRSVFGGCRHTIAVTTTGSVLSWGNNSVGQLGIGSSRVQSSLTPRHVRLPLDSSRAVAVGGGCDTGAVLTSRGQVLDWGAGPVLGTGSTLGSLSPVRVQLPAGRTAIGVGGGPEADFSLALLQPAR